MPDMSFNHPADVTEWSDDYPAINASADRSFNPAANIKIQTAGNPDAEFFQWFQDGRVHLLDLDAQRFDTAKQDFFVKATVQTPTTIETEDDPDAQFFAWLEASKISLLDLNGSAFQAIKAGYEIQYPVKPAGGEAPAGRISDAIACEALGVDEAELQLVADFIGHSNRPMDAVLADDDGFISLDDLRYLAKKKALRDFAKAQDRLVYLPDRGGEAIVCG